MICSANTDKGQKRSNNQDCYAVRKYTEKTYLAVVCDGMGGVRGGEEASQIACEAFVKTIDKCITPYLKNRQKQIGTSEIKRMLVKGIDLANEQVYLKSKQNPDHKGMGTTIVAALIIDKTAFCLNVGDSRLYLVKGTNIRQVTKDHSYVQYLIDMGQLTPEEAETSSNKNIITRAVGTEVSVEPDIYLERLEENSFMLLCTDGLTNMVDNATICDIVSGDKANKQIDQIELDLKTRKLIDTANENGGTDNITAVLLRF
ncbi:MAG: Stp1/IreP family PP2C-type Ser/Thr phosphatase [Clostridia bacterium]|nr:Stp1/IreP family PP2C-type Ser/Thr phosphatase [Clostridia bacterium]